MTTNACLVDSQTLRLQAYKDNSLLDKRKALYRYTQPHYEVDREVLQILEVRRPERLLDLGCGAGGFVAKASLTDPGLRCVGVDLSGSMLRIAANKCPSTEGSVLFTQADAQRLCFASNELDFVTCMHMMYHVPDISRAVAELARVLKPGGMLVITANSAHTKPELRKFKSTAATLLGTTHAPDATALFSIESAASLLSDHFYDVSTTLYTSHIVLDEPTPYVDYFDSLRSFWDVPLGDESWQQVLETVRSGVEEAIARDGEFRELNSFGICTAVRL
jgi:2-polyprenyl-3-methyl-5-hydroxy-6-metoxy-1,4-benzoquinol methylase